MQLKDGALKAKKTNRLARLRKKGLVVKYTAPQVTEKKKKKPDRRNISGMPCIA